MAGLFETYEKQYGNLTSEITFKLGKIPKLLGDDRLKEVHDTSTLFDETKELIEQMVLEVQEMRSDIKSKYATRLECYQKELTKLSAEFKRPRYAARKPQQNRTGLSDEEESLREEVLFDSDMRAQLLNNTERVVRSTTKLEDGVRMALQTEEIGGNILQDLSEQREKLQRSRDRLRQADTDLSKSSRILSSMTRRILQNRFILIGVVILMAVIFIVSIYLVSHRNVTTNSSTDSNLSKNQLNPPKL